MRARGNSMVRLSILAPVAALALAGCGDGFVTPPPTVVPPSVMSAPPLPTPAPPTFQAVPPEENTALVQPPAAAQPYRIEVEDTLDISVYGEEDLQHVEVPVRPDGMISFTFIGDVTAAGRTVEEVRAEMTQRLGQYLRSPQVTLIAKDFAQKKVYVGGEVKEPQDLMLGGREGTLLDALYKVGLVTEKADLDGAYLMRGNKVVAVDFRELVRGNVSRNVRLMDQDIVYVPQSVQQYVYVLGEVERNDAFAVTRPAPILEMISRAGGFTLNADRSEIVVVRGGLKAPQVAIVDGKRLLLGDPGQNLLVQPGDIIYVTLSGVGRYHRFIDELLRMISPIVQATIVSETVNP